MTDRPIIFSAPMVRALIEGRKTQTRRLLKPQPEMNSAGLWVWPPYGTKVTKRTWRGLSQSDADGLSNFFGSHNPKAQEALPYAPGDRLWVREACATWTGKHRDVVYRADETDEGWADLLVDASLGFWRIRPSIHMPRWASRLTLTVTDVRVQRLLDISGADAKAEGVSIPAHLPEDGADLDHARRAFRDLWTTLHGPDAWGANPWVVALTFKVQRRNIDAGEAAP